ncbi:uncharacterized protein PAC_14944 [Phialocephala subalpina]|uniref:C2H2-type domain-containing protein n=1 Tax=Phialocephala subalpina TaxID=576137 RepID=A0A1L7XJ46_9HELO|nr:uncharacterized protein PAC_14944 [Phialocephala subalpina]
MPPVITWHPPITIAVLAWLDFCNQHGLDFNQTVVKHLEVFTQTEFTIQQVMTHVDTFIRKERRNDPEKAVSRAKVRERGSSCLRALSQPIRKGIREALVEYQNFYQDMLPAHESRAVSMGPVSGKQTALSMTQDTQRRERPTSSLQIPSESVPSQKHQESHSMGRSKSLEDGATRRTEDTLPKPRTNHSTLIQNKEPKPVDTAQLEAEITRLEAQNLSLRRQWRTQVGELETREATRKAAEEKQQAEIQHLKDACRERERARWGNLEEELFKGLDAIGTELQSVLRDYSLAVSLTSPMVRTDSDLDLLLRSTISGVSNTTEPKGLLAGHLSNWGESMVVRGLAAVAIRDWVSDSDFPNRGKSEILEEYRKIISKCGGLTSLRNLELAAHHALTNSKYFNDCILPRKAGEYADRLSMALAPIFTQVDASPLNGTFASWGQENAKSESRRFRFRGIFKAALKLKAATVLTEETYELVLHPLGTLHSELCLDNKAHPGNKRKRNNDEGLWLHASLITYAAQMSNAHGMLADALVPTHNFSRECARGNRARLSTLYLTTSMTGDELYRYGPSLGEERSQEPILQNATQPQSFAAHPPRPPATKVAKLHVIDDIASKSPCTLARQSARESVSERSDSTLLPEPAKERQALATSVSPRRHSHASNISSPSPSCSQEDEFDDDYVETEHHGQKEKLWRCQKCNKSFATQDFFEGHKHQGKVVVAEPRAKSKVKCDKCGFEFASQKTKDKHEKNLPGVSENTSPTIRAEECSQCPECGRWLKDRQLLQKHLDVDHNEGTSHTTRMEANGSTSKSVRSEDHSDNHHNDDRELQPSPRQRQASGIQNTQDDESDEEQLPSPSKEVARSLSYPTASSKSSLSLLSDPEQLSDKSLSSP